MLDTLNITGVGINNSGYAVDSLLSTVIMTLTFTVLVQRERIILMQSEIITQIRLRDYLNKILRVHIKLIKLLNSAD